MPNIVDSLVVSLGLDASELKRGLDDAGRSLQGVLDGMKSGAAEADAAVKNLSAGALLLGGASDEVAGQIANVGTASQKAAAVAGRAFSGVRSQLAGVQKLLSGFVGPLLAAFGAGRVIANFSEQGEALAVLSERIGVNAQQIDAWAKANRDAGGSAEAFTGALENWVLETGRGADEFFRLGEHVKGMSEVQAQYFLRTMGLSQESAAVFVKFRDRADEAAAAYRGVAMTQAQVERAREANILWRRFTDQVQSLGTLIITALLPVVTKLMSVVNAALGFLAEHGRAVKLAVTAAAVVIGASFLPTVLNAVAGVGGLVKALLSAGGAAKAFSAALMANPLAAVIAGVAALLLVLEDLWAFFEGGDSLFGRFLAWLGMSEEAVEDLRGAFRSVANFLAGFDLGDFARKLWEPIRQVLAWVLGVGDEVAAFFDDLPLRIGRAVEDGLSALGASALDWGRTLADGILSALETLWDWIGGMGEHLAEALAGAARKFLGPVLSVLDAVKGFAGSVSDSVGGAVDKVKGFFGLGERAEGKAEADPTTAPRGEYVHPDAEPRGGFWALFPKPAPKPEGEAAAATPNGFDFSADFADILGDVETSRQAVTAQSIQQGAGRSVGVENSMSVTVENHIQTQADPQAVAGAVSSSVGSALRQSNAMLVNAQTGVVQKG